MGGDIGELLKVFVAAPHLFGSLGQFPSGAHVVFRFCGKSLAGEKKLPKITAALRLEAV
jgi:hypothetical protein